MHIPTSILTTRLLTDFEKILISYILTECELEDRFAVSGSIIEYDLAKKLEVILDCLDQFQLFGFLEYNISDGETLLVYVDRAILNDFICDLSEKEVQYV